jgi:hypothetical protein
MAGMAATAKNGMLDAEQGGPLRQRITHLSLHTADSGSGASEVTGNGYTRVAVTTADFTVAAGELTLNNNKTFAGPANSAVVAAGYWASGTFLGNGLLTGDLTFNAAGAYVVASGTRIHLNATPA